jgi:hypothetical protein
MPSAVPATFEEFKASLLIASSWAALTCYAWSLVRLAWDRTLLPGPRRIWTMGCLFYVAHMILAFEVAYRWSHEAAIADIGSQSEAISGVRAPWGLFVNYAYGAVWMADLAWWWRVGDRAYRERSRVSHWILHGLFLFMLFNGAFVFVERWTRWFGLFLFVVSSWAACNVRVRQSRWLPSLPKSSF